MKRIAVIFLIITIFSSVIPSYAEEANEAKYSEDYNFAVSLGIMPDDLEPAEAITRIDLARCFTGIIMPDGISDAYDESKYFNDVEYSFSAYADTVYGLGIMNGVGDGSFEPNEFVTYNQLIKTFVSFLGYDVKAQELGGYPSGYKAAAVSMGLDYDLKGASDEDYVTCENVATFFKKAVNVSLYERKSYGSEKKIYFENDKVNYLTEYMKIYRLRGIIKGVHGSNLSDNGELDYNEVIVDTTKMFFDPDKMDLTDNLGMCLDVFYKVNNEKNEILYFEEYENNVIKLNGEDIDKCDDTNITYYDGLKKQKIRINGYTQIVYNNSLCKSYSESVLNPWADGNLDGGLVAVDNDNDNIYDYIFIDAYETYVVNMINENKIIPLYRKNVIIDLGEYNDGESALIKNILGEPVSIASIESGSIISVSRNLDGDVTSVIVTVDEYVGVLDLYTIKDDIYYFTIGGQTFKGSNSLKNNDQLDKIETGSNIKLIFNKDGLVSDIEAAEYQVNRIGYVVDSAIERRMGGDIDAQIKIFTSGDVFEACAFAEKVDTCYGLGKYRLKPNEVLDKLGYTGNGEVIRQPIYYRKNSDGEINWIQICNMADGEIDGFYKFNGTVLDETPKSYEYRSSSFGGKILVKGSTIFAVPSEENRYDEDLYHIQKLYSGYTYTPVAYGTKKNSRVASVIVINNAENEKFYNPSGVLIVDDVFETIGADGNTCMRVTGMSEGASKEYDVKKDILTADGVMPQNGDILRLTVQNDGSVSAVAFIFDESTRTFPKYTSNPTSSYSDSNRFLYGKIVWADEDSMNVRSINPSTGVVTEDSYVKSTGYQYYKVKKERNGKRKISMVTKDEFMIYADTAKGEEEPNIFIHSTSGDPKSIVMYE